MNCEINRLTADNQTNIAELERHKIFLKEAETLLNEVNKRHKVTLKENEALKEKLKNDGSSEVE